MRCIFSPNRANLTAAAPFFDMKQIPLSQGKFALVDDEDFEFLNQWKWSAHKDYNTFYATRNERQENGKYKMISMHRQILGLINPKDLVDHEDGNGLNNSRANLRKCTHTQNSRNRTLPKSNTSGFKGVSFYKKTGKYIACIEANGKGFNLGYYKTKEDAAFAYDIAAEIIFEDFSNPNFPNQLPPPKIKERVVYALSENRLHSNNTSGLRGVSFLAKINKFVAKIASNGKSYHIGSFQTKEEAARAYDEAAKKYHGEKAKLNFH